MPSPFTSHAPETDLPAWTESYAGLGPRDLSLETVTQRFDEFVANARL